MQLDRVLMLAGAVLSLCGALVLVICGGSLLRSVAAVDALQPESLSDLQHDLHLSVLAALGMGAGLALVAYALDLARRIRALGLPAKTAVTLAGVLCATSGVLLFVAFNDVADQLETWRRSAPDAEAIAGFVRESMPPVTGGFYALLTAQIALGISLWSLVWTHARAPRSSHSAPVAALAVLSAAGFGALLAWGARSAAAALATVGPAGSPFRAAAFWESLGTAQTYAVMAFCCLVLYGTVLALKGILFPLDRAA